MTTDEAVREAKELLQLHGDVSLVQLLEALAELRINAHPDKFRSESGKRAAAERFKRAGELLDQLTVALEEANLSGAPSTGLMRLEHTGVPAPEVILARATLKMELATQLGKQVDLQDELASAKMRIDLLEHEKSNLQEQLRKRRRRRLVRTRARIIEKYRASKRSIVTLGFSAGLALLYALLSQVESATKRLIEPLGIAPELVGVVVFMTFALTALVAAHGWVRGVFASAAIEDLCGTAAVQRFAEQVRELRKDEFGDGQVLNFVMSELKPTTPAHRLLSLLNLKHFNSRQLDEFKNVFVAHMLDNELIEAGPVHEFEHIFRVRKRERYSTWNDYGSLLDDEAETTDAEPGERG
jgi:hypothetical protein